MSETSSELPKHLTPLPKFCQLSSRVWRILGLNPGMFTLQGTNCYLVGSGDRLVLIDCGEGIPEYIPLLQQSLQQISPNAYISDLLITHCHTDHWGGVKDVLGMDSSINVHKFPATSTAYDGQRFQEIFPSDVELLPLHDDQILKIDDNTTLRAIHAPGHSSDDCSFWLEEEQALFAGDCVLGYGTTSFDDVAVYINSLEQLKALNPRVLYPGHGPVVDDAIGKIQEYIELRIQRENEILQVILANPSKPTWTAYEVTADLWKGKRETHDIRDIHVRGIGLHLKKLGEDGKLKKLDYIDSTLEEKIFLNPWSKPEILKIVWMYTGGLKSQL
ncbi:beta-lactamase-like protein [Zychaea mexicana]|uniref:beta-lactamase-like protein n=1 Tax=Zychaea mexicana TaxID=64656 RepID=UPI0022FE21DF|nr:beta-lactamase-like protein [Zychaea mexicana]KAI9490410.1 beta-lactamase-like protein [Zychaea mexicana]